jgi:hypothetical protein
MQHLTGFLQERLIEEVQKEANQEWSKKPNPPLPKMVEVVKVKGRAGFINFFKELTP